MAAVATIGPGRTDVTTPSAASPETDWRHWHQVRNLNSVESTATKQWGIRERDQSPGVVLSTTIIDSLFKKGLKLDQCITFKQMEILRDYFQVFLRSVNFSEMFNCFQNL